MTEQRISPTPQHLKARAQERLTNELNRALATADRRNLTESEALDTALAVAEGWKMRRDELATENE